MGRKTPASVDRLARRFWTDQILCDFVKAATKTLGIAHGILGPEFENGIVENGQLLNVGELDLNMIEPTGLRDGSEKANHKR